jgi:hypothetical protein
MKTPLSKLIVAGVIAAIAIPVTAAGAAGIFSHSKPSHGKPLHNAVTGGKAIAALKKRGYKNEGASGRLRLTDSSVSANPCSLVTASEATKVFGKRARKPHEAPMGPTCIYRTGAKEKFVTLSVQRMGAAQLGPLTAGMDRFRVGGRTAYCGGTANPALYVRLSSANVLTVSGGCDLGRQFASRAVRKLG